MNRPEDPHVNVCCEIVDETRVLSVLQMMIEPSEQDLLRRQVDELLVLL